MTEAQLYAPSCNRDAYGLAQHEAKAAYVEFLGLCLRRYVWGATWPNRLASDWRARYLGAMHAAIQGPRYKIGVDTL